MSFAKDEKMDRGAMKTKTRMSLAFAAVLLAMTLADGQAQAGKSEPKAASSFPSCTDNLSSVAMPKAPHGLFAILFPGMQKLNAKANEYLLHNPVVCGANFYLVWNRIDKGPDASSRYDFDAVEEQMEPWIKAGKEVNLIAWAVGYGAKVQVTPEYVFKQVQSVECENGGQVPVFWDKGFMDNYQQFMKEIVHHFGNNAAVGYIRFGLGIGGETFPVCMYALREKGFTPQVWRKYLFDMLDYEGALNSPKTLMVGINTFGEPPNIDFVDAVADRAVQNKIAIGSQALSMDDPRSDRAGQPCAVDWCHVFRGANGKVPLELQTLEETNPDRSGKVGSMVDLLPFALGLHTQIFEIYMQDWLIAYDPEDPNYARYHEEYQRTYEAAAKVVGGH
jgi:hypothetical protein